MVSFVIDESHLRRLSPSARQELLKLLAADAVQLRAEFAGRDWAPDRDLSYPLTPEEARILIRGISEAGRQMLRVFARSFDGEVGRGEVHALMEATGHDHYEQLSQEISATTQSLRSITGNYDAWLFNFRAEDWVWDEESRNYTRGQYFISGPAILSLRQAFGMGPASDRTAAQGE